MALIDFKNLIHYRGNKVRFLLLASFVVLFLIQIFLGIKELEDFLVVLIFALFMNDFIFKYRHPETLTIAELTDAEKIKRKKIFPLIMKELNMDEITFKWYVTYDYTNNFDFPTDIEKKILNQFKSTNENQKPSWHK